MPTVERPQNFRSASLSQPREDVEQDVEVNDGLPRFRAAVKKVIIAKKAFHQTQQEDDGSDCCDDALAWTGIGQDKQQNDIDRMWTKNAAVFDDPDEDIDFRDLMNVKFAEDSGFSDVPKLWVDGQSMKVRIFHAFLALAFAVYNSDYIIESDFHAMQMNGTTGHGGNETFLVSRVMWNAGVDTFYPGHHLVSTTHNHWLIGVMELSGLCMLFFQCFGCLVAIHCPRLLPRYWFMSAEKREGRMTRGQWLCSTHMYTSLIPQIGSYSGMRLLHFVQTKSITTDISKIKAMPKITTSRRYLAWVYFIVSRLFCLVVGFDMFLTKFRVAKEQGVFMMKQDDSFEWVNLFRSFLFMKQVLGVLKVDVLVRERLFLFVFGGPESEMLPKEKAVQLVWEALTTRRVYRKCTEQYGNILGTLGYQVVMLTFGDEDFQRLTLDPKRDPSKE